VSWAANSLFCMISKNSDEPSLSPICVTGEENTRAKTEAGESLSGATAPPMHREALIRETRRMNSTSVEEKEGVA
jgi:hypothetical protein